MFRTLLILLGCVCAGVAAERRFDFTGHRPGETPTGFRSALTGKGEPGEWRIAMDTPPQVIAPFTSRAPVVPQRPVLAQLSRDRGENRTPLFIFEHDTFGDFTFHTRIKIVGGENDQMAGIAFRMIDDRNFYYVRINAKNKNAAFFRMVEGELIGPISAPAEVRVGEWHLLTVECRGAKLRALVDEKEIVPWTEPGYVPFPDGSSKGVFNAGKIGFWTRGDTVAHFTDAHMTYTPREPFAQTLIRETMRAHPRLLGLKIFSLKPGETVPRVIGSHDEKQIGTSGETVEKDCIERGGTYFGKGKESAVVTMPLHDRNGETVGAVRVVMTTFLGQTEKNALGRAFPIVKWMESRVTSARDLLE